MPRRRLPIGIQNFREVRETDCYYVDKTAYIVPTLKEGKHYFLSRPRRFGKSLFLDTCKELFEGNEELFRGLAIHDRWDWSARHPVLRLSFASGHFERADDLRTEVADRLLDFEDQAGTPGRHASAPGRLRHLIESLHRNTDTRRRSESAASKPWWFPRTRGDRPSRRGLARSDRWVPLQHAGIDPIALSTFAPVCGFPRTRGIGPARSRGREITDPQSTTPWQAVS